MIKFKIQAVDGADLRKQLLAILGQVGGDVIQGARGPELILHPAVEQAKEESTPAPDKKKRATTPKVETPKVETPKEEEKKEESNDDDEIEDRLYSKDEIEEAVIKVDNNPAVRDLMSKEFGVTRMSDIKPSQQVEFLTAIRKIKPLG